MGIWSLDDLLEAINRKMDYHVSERTLKEDLKRMKDDIDLAYYAPIENKRGIGYYYADESFKLTEAPLSPVEVEALKDVVELLHQFKGFKYFEGAEGLIYHIEENINKTEFADIQFHVLPDYLGLEFIEPIKRAIRGKRVLKMTYKGFGEEAEIPRHIHPYLLKEYNNRWFVYAYTNEYKGEGVYGLERIKKLEITDKKYRHPNKKKIIAYFKDIIGVTNFEDREVEEIVLRMKRDRANYLMTKPIHKSQKIIKENKEFVWFRFHLKPNNELNALILSFGEDVVVEKPRMLVEEIKKLLSDALKHYAEKPAGS
jgi:predicted DNA-binding transcriptional regulator YafY